MSHKIVNTDKAPAAIGPYSQACIGGNLLFISGQIPINPEFGTMVEGDIKVATKQCLDNLFAIVSAAGDDVHLVKVTIFLVDMDNFADVNEAYKEYFKENPPARACVEVSRLPKDANIEIEGIAVLPK